MRVHAVASVLLSATGLLNGQGLGSLRRVTPPQPDVSRYVQSSQVLLVLGKALFWDMQVGSDSRTACATCHFHAGADHRIRSQYSNPSGAFEADHAQSLGDFPFRVFADAANNRSNVERDSGQRAGSAGVFRRAEDGTELADAPAFRAGGLNLRQVTPRNTPSIIDSVFNLRNFWDGRASDIFTGATPFGDSDARANALVIRDGAPVAEKVRIEQASLASQAVGPPLSTLEMSYDGRTWTALARKLLAARPLAGQRIVADDSVLGGVDLDGKTYLDLVRAAFRPEYWDWPDPVDGATVAERNFPLFFGLAIQAYEATLISGQSRFDRFSEGDSAALTAEEQNGLRIFQRSECTDCHLGPEFTMASAGSIAQRGQLQRLRQGVTTDTGFIHTGVRAETDDTGLDAKDDFGQPFSIAARQGQAALGITGAFKTPGLRNIEFTGPFFHNGGQATLEQVIDFYNRGGDFPDSRNLSPDVHRLNLTADEKAALVAFLKALSDDRVRFERAPFDHPELCVPHGYDDAADPNFPLSAMDRWVGIPAVGAQGNAVPLQTFVELLQGTGADGSRAHSLTDACAVIKQ